ncbi:hypothetical protein [Halomicrobium urmianum]|nr:hypothetical protein [Halomicrobium urmianum]
MSGQLLRRDRTLAAACVDAGPAVDEGRERHVLFAEVERRTGASA